MKNHIYVIGTFLFLLIITMVSCSEKDYNCQCTVDGPDTGSVSLDHDTTLIVSATREEVAETECEAYEGVSSALIPNNAATQQFTISCGLE